MGGCILCRIADRDAGGNGKRRGAEDPPTPRLRRDRPAYAEPPLQKLRRARRYGVAGPAYAEPPLQKLRRGRQGTEDGGQRMEDGGWRMEDGG
jgi:hypothetical protein